MDVMNFVSEWSKDIWLVRLKNELLSFHPGITRIRYVLGGEVLFINENLMKIGKK